MILKIIYLWTYILTLFVRSFGFQQGICLSGNRRLQKLGLATFRPKAGLYLSLFLRQATPQGSKRTTKTSLLLGEPANSKKLFYGKRTQFQGVKSVASNCCRKVYDALLRKRNEPKRTQLKPIKANFFKTPKTHLPALSIAEGSAELFSGILTITKKPYFAKRTQFQQPSLHLNSRNNKELQQITPKPPPQKRTQYEPNTNPIRTQFEPNTNPIRTRSKPNYRLPQRPTEAEPAYKPPPSLLI